MTLEDYLKQYILDKGLQIPDEDFTVLSTVDVFYSLGIDVNEITSCVENAGVQQLYYVINNIDRFKGESGITSISVTNYSIGYDSSKGMVDYISPLAYQLLVRCGLITMTINKVRTNCGIFE